MAEEKEQMERGKGKWEGKWREVVRGGERGRRREWEIKMKMGEEGL